MGINYYVAIMHTLHHFRPFYYRVPIILKLTDCLVTNSHASSNALNVGQGEQLANWSCAECHKKKRKSKNIEKAVFHLISYTSC